MELVPETHPGYATLMESLEEALSTSQSRSVLSYIYLRLVRKLAPEITGRVLRRAGRDVKNPFGYTPMPTSVAACAVLGVHVWPQLDLLEGANRVLQEMLLHFRDDPFVQTFMRATEGQWALLIKDWKHVEKLLSTVESELRMMGENQAIITFDEPLGRYAMLGFLPGMMSLMEVDGEVSLEGWDELSASVRIRWSA